MELSKEVKKAYELAKEARLNAYAPYSKFLVGACLKVKGQDLYISGHNIENASYGSTVCAERTAIWSAITQHKVKDFEFMVLVTQCEPAGTPCGMCLQIMSEFVDGDFPLYLSNLNAIEKKLPFREFLPNQFNKDSLNS